MALELIKLVKGSSAVSQVGSLGFFKLSADTGGGGGDLTFSRVFSENTPEQISAVSAVISANNMTSEQVSQTYGWNVGDTIDITLTTGEAIQMRIIGFNHDDKSDGSGKAGITLEMVNCLATRYPMNPGASNSGGWGASQLRNTTLPTIKATLPVEWQYIIKKVDKKSANGGYKNYTETLTLSEDIFFLSVIEIFGIINAQDGANEGSVYEYWSGKTNADRIKKYDKDADGVPETATHSWLRSSPTAYTDTFCTVSSSGGSTTVGVAANNSRGVFFAFCV